MTLVRHLGLLLTVVAASLLAGAGVVLAQANAADVERTKPASASKPTPQSKPPSAKNDVIPNRYIVILDGSEEATAQGRQGESRKQEAEQVANDLSQESKVEEVTQTYGSAIKGFAAKIPEEEVDEVRSDPRVEFVAEDREAHITAQTFVTGVDRVDAELSSTQAGNGSGSVDVDIAVIDTGIYTRHADLNIAGGKDCSTDGKRTYSDDNGHGTHVAGSAAAKDNTTGVVGVAPGARLWAVKVLKANGSGSWSDIICGIDYVTQQSSTIEVANMSLGGGPITSADDGQCGNSNRSGDQGTADAVHKAVCNSVNNGKVTYTVAAGNETDDSSKYIPAAFDEAITVSALADYDGEPGFQGDEFDCFQDWAFDDEFAYFSNYGSDVDIAAPGVCIRSTWKGSKKKRKGTYKTISGTSMASPHVAGAAALYKVGQPTALPSAVRTDLISTSNTEGPGTTTYDNPWSKPHNERVMLANNY